MCSPLFAPAASFPPPFRKYRYDLHTALYMLDPWERALFNTVLIVILAWSARLAAASFFGSGHGAASQ